MDASEWEWGASGLAYLTGPRDGPPDFSCAAVLARAQSVAADLHRGIGVPVDAAELLAGRAALLGLSRRGRVSAGGATRLISALDGWCALTLSRPDDVEAVPALVEASDLPDDPWPIVEGWAALRTAAEVVERTRLLGLPAAVLGETRAAPPVVRRVGPTGPPRGPAGLLVVDLSSMWAGPVCGQLLARAGATVVKVESTARPDGTRAGAPAFFDWMNGGKLCYEADFDNAARLRTLLGVADVVIESSRSAALRQRRLGPDDVAARDGRVWVRITGHGADGEQANWTAFGDDAAVGGGLVGRSADGPVFCADAIADPLTGLHATVAVADSLASGGGEVIDVAMAAVAATYAALPRSNTEKGCHAAYPSCPDVPAVANVLGADNERVDQLVSERRLARC